MVTLIIAALIVGFFTIIIQGFGGKVREAKLMKGTNEAFLTPIIELESMGFTVIGKDPAIIATIEKGRRDKSALLKGADDVPIDETIAECAADPEMYKIVSNGITAIKDHCNVEIIPDLREEVNKYKAGIL